ncbi:MAG: relaxase/mobilization nuclease domain-containing protein [Clostridia bacterium]|nr:relaxase/mobilization nuclease domain-containing protein [Clostridia bacterium]MBQ7348348.1 relaxase/mobilization nuclease domain-containing protein [Clostridia bacterium]
MIRYVAKPSKTWNGQYGRAAEYHALENVLQYTADQMKTEMQYYVSGVNCDAAPDAAREQFEITKRNWEKEGGIVCFHGYQSFAHGEVTPEVAHAIGIELAKRLWGDRFEVLVTTHLNTKAVHNHFCLNSVSFIDGLRYYDQKATYRKMREVSDALCREWGLSVIEPKGRGRHIGEVKDEENGKLTMRGQIKADIDQAIKENYSWRSFCKTLGELGYVLEWRGRFFRIRPDNGKKFFRFDRLGEGYSVEDIRRRLNENFYRLHRSEEEPFVPPKRDRAKGLYALFLYYQYLLGHLPKSRPPNDPEAYAQMKADRKKLQNYSDAAKLLGKYQLYTAEQLHDHTERISEQFKSLAITRKKLHNRLKRMHDSEQMQPIKDQIMELTERMAELRKEMKICTNVAEWSDAVEVIVNRIENPEISKERKVIQEKDVPRS